MFCVSIYDKLYPRVSDEICRRAEHGIHGSEVRDLFLGFGFAVDNQAERLLSGLVDAGVLVHDPIATPTHSQAAFLGLQVRKHPGFVPGCIEHFVFRAIK